MKLEIAKGRSRVYFDRATSYLRIDFDGAGPGMELTPAECMDLACELVASARAKRRASRA